MQPLLATSYGDFPTYFWCGTPRALSVLGASFCASTARWAALKRWGYVALITGACFLFSLVGGPTKDPKSMIQIIIFAFVVGIASFAIGKIKTSKNEPSLRN